MSGQELTSESNLRMGEQQVRESYGEISEQIVFRSRKMIKECQVLALVLRIFVGLALAKFRSIPMAARRYSRSSVRVAILSL